jgi:hypothetical protein
MPRQQWPLSGGRPVIELELIDATTGDALPRLLLADTGGGDAAAGFDLIMHQDDCDRCAKRVSHRVQLGGAYSGWYPVYLMRVQIPTIGFDDSIHAVGMADTTDDFDGIACFRFLNRFTYGNFGDANGFGLEL